MKKTLKYHAPAFFLNVGENNELGHSVLMVSKKCTSKDEVTAFMGTNRQVSLTYSFNTDVDIVLNVYEDNMISSSISLTEIENDKYFIAILPLIDTIWDLSKEDQSLQVKYAKDALLGSLIENDSLLNIDIEIMELVLEKYSKNIEKIGESIKYGFISLPEYDSFIQHVKFIEE